MQDRKHPGASDGEQGHRLGEPVDRGSPLLPHQQKNRGDQSAGVTDSDPPDKIDDGKAPRDRDVDPPDPGALEQQVPDGPKEDHHQAESDTENQKPAEGRLPGQDDPADLVGDRAVGVVALQDGRRPLVLFGRWSRRLWLIYRCHACISTPFQVLDWGSAGRRDRSFSVVCLTHQVRCNSGKVS